MCTMTKIDTTYQGLGHARFAQWRKYGHHVVKICRMNIWSNSWCQNTGIMSCKSAEWTSEAIPDVRIWAPCHENLQNEHLKQSWCQNTGIMPSKSAEWTSEAISDIRIWAPCHENLHNEHLKQFPMSEYGNHVMKICRMNIWSNPWCLDMGIMSSKSAEWTSEAIPDVRIWV